MTRSPDQWGPVAQLGERLICIQEGRRPTNKEAELGDGREMVSVLTDEARRAEETAVRSQGFS